MSNNRHNLTGRLGNLLVITAPSGAGKSTLVTRLRQSVEGIAFSVSYTTRPPRATEQHGREYYFVSVEEFEQMRARNEFLEWAVVHTNYYGTHCDAVREALAAGYDIVLDIDVQGAAQIKRVMPQAVLVFIMPPSFAALSERLCNRGLDSQAVIEHRLRTAASEVARYQEFDFVIINDDLEAATTALVSIARAMRYQPSKCEAQIANILASFKESKVCD